MEAYKYVKRKYLKRFIEKGLLRIATIYWFRDCESKKIRDPFEGRTKYVICPEKESICLSIEQVNAITNEYNATAKICIEPSVHFSDFLNVPNALVFCTSRIFSSKLFKKFDADSCYKIRDIQKFADKLGEEINNQIPLRLAVKDTVIYVPSKEFRITNENKNLIIRTSPYDKTGVKTIYVEDYFTKPNSFQAEVEYRFIFIPQKPVEKDRVVFIKSKKLIDYCEEITDF